MSSTKDRILDAAEMLFTRQGVEGTSLRSITQSADVNGAAIHYHFGSKAELVEALIQRRIAPVNERRLEHLEELEAAACGAPVEIEQLVSAFLNPFVEARAELQSRGPELAGLFAWLRFEPGADFARIRDEFQEVRSRYAAAVAQSVGDIDVAEADERLGFAVGATFHVLHGAADAGRSDEDIAESVQHLTRFLAAGFRAPAASVARRAERASVAPPRPAAAEGARA